MTLAEKELPVISPKSSGKRGKLAKSDAHNLWERLKIHEAAVLLFAKDPHVSFTNNRAERDLRMSMSSKRFQVVSEPVNMRMPIAVFQAICSPDQQGI